jgi:hypothetical protein
MATLSDRLSYVRRGRWLADEHCRQRPSLAGVRAS